MSGLNTKYLLAILVVALSSCSRDTESLETQSGAGLAMDAWHYERSYPDQTIPNDIYIEESTAELAKARPRGQDFEFKSLGPKNIGGRTLALGFDPNDPYLMYAGSASGGLWRTYTAGVGEDAWERVETGFPVLAVGAVAVHPTNPEVIFIGTGEVYNNEAPQPGLVNRLTRGTYGIGILVSMDGGFTWEKSLDWSEEDLTGVQEIYIEKNSGDVYAATTEGLYRTKDLGLTWNLLHDMPMAVDVDVHPTNSNIIYVSHGSYRNTQVGIYRSVDGGETFQKLYGGLPQNYSGKSMIAIAPSNPSRIFASVADYQGGKGLWRSDDGGNNWMLASSLDFPLWQGWYAHDVIVSPHNQDWVTVVGIETWVSTNGGTIFDKRSYWNHWYLGQVEAGEPEGQHDYVHADIHRLYYHPMDQTTLYMVTDGGIFVSENQGSSFEGRNGGYQTTQFYANFSNSPTDSILAIGGMQDNATAIYQGNDSWYRVLSGDGMSTAIDHRNYLYGSYQNLAIKRSRNQGQSFESITVGSAFNEATAFSAPFELSNVHSDMIFAGAQRLHISANAGLSWLPTSSNPIFMDNVLLKIAPSFQTDDVIFVSTVSLTKNPPSVMRSTDQGATWAHMDQLPNRIAKDIAIDPRDHNIVYVAFSGFGTSHIYKTIDGGESWFASDTGIPDLPTNTIFIDPDFPDMLYAGNDIGVYMSEDAGASWTFISHELTDVVMVMDLGYSPTNRKLRVATHGNGVYETNLYEPTNTSVHSNQLLKAKARVFPNPTSDWIKVSVLDSSIPEYARFDLTIISRDGKEVQEIRNISSTDDIDVSSLPEGFYMLKLDMKLKSKYITASSSFVKI